MRVAKDGWQCVDYAAEVHGSELDKMGSSSSKEKMWEDRREMGMVARVERPAREGTKKKTRKRIAASHSRVRSREREREREGREKQKISSGVYVYVLYVLSCAAFFAL